MRFFASGFFPWIIFPQAPENKIRVISNFFQKFAESQCAPTDTKDIGGKFAISVDDNLPPVSTTPVAKSFSSLAILISAKETLTKKKHCTIILFRTGYFKVTCQVLIYI